MLKFIKKNAQLITAEELCRMKEGDVRRELSKGVVIEMSPTGSRHGDIALEIGMRLRQFVKKHNLGIVFAAETGFRLARDPDTVRAPDVAYVNKERIPAEGIPDGYWEGAPDLAVEVLSPSDSMSDVLEKIQDYLSAGTNSVWIVDPRSKLVSIYSSLWDVKVLSNEDIVQGQNELSSFRLKVNDLWFYCKRHS